MHRYFPDHPPGRKVQKVRTLSRKTPLPPTQTKTVPTETFPVYLYCQIQTPPSLSFPHQRPQEFGPEPPLECLT